MIRFVFVFLLSGLCSLASIAADDATAADHQALRKLKSDVVAAVNKRDYPAMQQFMHRPFMATLITQDHFEDTDKLKDYFETLFTRPTLRMSKVSIEADADALSQIYEGTFALNKGTTKEHYELADGRAFDIDGRWTAVSRKENGEWKLLAVHTGTNFLDNPVLNAIEKSVLWFAAGGVLAGLVVGFALGWLLRRRAEKRGA